MFLPRRSHSGFYSSIPDFLARAILPPSDPNAVLPGLLSAIYLAACSIAGGPFLAYTDYFLRETRRLLQQSLAYVDRLTDFLWGSMILAAWLARAGLFGECKVQITTTVRFALGCGLAGPPDQGILPPPVTVEDAIDRIHVRFSPSPMNFAGAYFSVRAADPHRLPQRP